MTSAAIYARVSSARQKKDETIGSQTAALREHAAQARLEVPEELGLRGRGAFGRDAGPPGPGGAAGPGRPGLRGRGAGATPRTGWPASSPTRRCCWRSSPGPGCGWSSSRARAGTAPEDQLLVQFQGMFAEYEKAQLMERYRRGKAHRARAGSVNVLAGAPFGYRYVRKTDRMPAPATRSSSTRRCWWRRCSAATPTTAPPSRTWPAGWPAEGAVTRTGKHRWDRSRWSGACCATPPTRARAVFGKTQVIQEQPGTEPRRPAAGPHGAAAGQDRGPAAGGMDRRSRSRPSCDQDTFARVRPAAGRQQEATPPAAPRSPPCCRAWPPARPAATATTAPRPAPPGARSTTTGAWAPTTTGTKAAGSAATSRSAPTTSTRSSGTTSPACSPTRP